MTKQQIIRLGLARAGQYGAAGAALDPILLDALYNDLMDQLTQTADALYLSYGGNLVDGQAVYCAPPLYFIDEVTIEISDGGARRALMLGGIADAMGVPSLRVSPESGVPTMAFTEGLNSVRLFPTPNYDTTGTTPVDGIVMWGFGTYDPASYGMTAENPLPTRHHMGLVHGLAWQINTGDLHSRSQWQGAKARILEEAGAKSAAIRSRYPVSGSLASLGTLPTGENPLNL
jgi:hypothetical protein